MLSFIIVSENRDTIDSVFSGLRSQYRLDPAAGVQQALTLLENTPYDLMFIDLPLVHGSGESDSRKALHCFWKLRPSLEVVVMTPKDLIRGAVKAVRAGAFEYLSYPLDAHELQLVVENFIEHRTRESELAYLRDHFWKSDWQDVVQTQSEKMGQVLDKIRIVAPTKTTVLLTGETGTGKSLFAKLIHQHSNRADGRFISVHCGAIPDTLIESELFGHEKGSFTGAVKKKLGQFELAGTGTIFLDEVGTISPQLQIKLLQVLQDRTFSRVGGETVLTASTRVIAAANTDLKQMAEEGRFRKDLYFRLNVFPIEIPPLRERPEDLPHIVEACVKKFGRDFQKNFRRVDPDVLERLKRYDWPGNIRELENIVERACLLETSTTLTPESFPGEIMGGAESTCRLPVMSDLTLAEARQLAVTDFERQYLKDLLARYKGRMNPSAAAAGISTRQLHKLLSKYDIRKEAYKNPSIPPVTGWRRY